MVPTFGRNTIRRISANASEQKKLAARDYEDYLQVCHLHANLKHTEHSDSVPCLFLKVCSPI
jgi:hypothetical protein